MDLNEAMSKMDLHKANESTIFDDALRYLHTPYHVIQEF